MAGQGRAGHRRQPGQGAWRLPALAGSAVQLLASKPTLNGRHQRSPIPPGQPTTRPCSRCRPAGRLKGTLLGVSSQPCMPLSVEGQAHRLIEEASNKDNLGMMYIWWCAPPAVPPAVLPAVLPGCNICCVACGRWCPVKAPPPAQRVVGPARWPPARCQPCCRGLSGTCPACPACPACPPACLQDALELRLKQSSLVAGARAQQLAQL